MAYKRTPFDIVRLHSGGVILTGMVINSIEGEHWTIAGLLALLLLGFMKLESELLPTKNK